MQLLSRKKSTGALMERNAFLKNPGRLANTDDLVANNKASILKHYTGKGYQARLLETYQQVVNTPVQHVLDKARLIDQFLDLDNFSLLKWKPYDG